MSLARLQHELDIVAGCARGVREPLAHHWRDDVVAHAVRQQRAGTPSGEPPGRRRVRVALRHLGPAPHRAGGARCRPTAAARDASRRSTTPAWDTTAVTATRRRSRLASHAARWPPAEWPIATTRVRSSTPCLCAGISVRRSTAAATSSSLRVTAAGEPPEPPVLHVPRGPPARRQGRRTARASACARAAPSRTRRAARRRPGTGRPRAGEAAERQRALPYGWCSGSDTQRARRPASRVTPSSICSGVTPSRRAAACSRPPP